MAPSTLDYGKRARLRNMADLPLLMEIAMKVIGSVTKLMANLAATTIPMDPVILVNGLRTARRAEVSNVGPMGAYTKASITKARSMGMGISLGLTAPSMRDSGKQTRCMAREFSSGLMDGHMRASIRMTKNTAAGVL